MVSPTVHNTLAGRSNKRHPELRAQEKALGRRKGRLFCAPWPFLSCFLARYSCQSGPLFLRTTVTRACERAFRFARATARSSAAAWARTTLTARWSHARLVTRLCSFAERAALCLGLLVLPGLALAPGLCGRRSATGFARERPPPACASPCARLQRQASRRPVRRPSPLPASRAPPREWRPPPPPGVAPAPRARRAGAPPGP